MDIRNLYDTRHGWVKGVNFFDVEFTFERSDARNFYSFTRSILKFYINEVLGYNTRNSDMIGLSGDFTGKNQSTME